MDSSNHPHSEAPTAESDTRQEQRLGNHSPSARATAARRRVFFLVDSLNVGGTETQAVELATRLNPQRYEVTLGCLRARGPLLEKLAGSPASVREFVPRGGVDSVNGVYQLVRLVAFLRRGRFQIVHSHDLYSNLLGIPAAIIARVPVIISSRRDLAHLDWYQSGRRVWLRRLPNLSTLALTNAAAILEPLLAEHPLNPHNVHHIPNRLHIR